MGWADKVRRLRVRANADQPDQSANAVAFGAEGIGLCRTEHMFFGGDRITAVREMILGDTVEAREKALAKLLPMQREDFVGIFRAMGPRPSRSGRSTRRSTSSCRTRSTSRRPSPRSSASRRPSSRRRWASCTR
jgi:hypothetical protein